MITLKKVRQGLPTWLRFAPAVTFMLLIFWFSSIPGVDLAQNVKPLTSRADTTVKAIPSLRQIKIQWLKVGHFIGYSSLGLALLYAFLPYFKHNHITAILTTALYALTDEFHQTFVAGRHAGLNDVLLDTSAAAFMILLFSITYRFISHCRSETSKASSSRILPSQ